MAEKPDETAAVIDPREFDALLLDLDGVITRTAVVHAAAWKKLFDEYLSRRAERGGEPFRAFDSDGDYRRYVDGKPRYDGVKSFLESRGISLPWGTPDDGPDRETVCGLGNRKNEYFHERLERNGVEVYTPAVEMVRAARARGLKVAVVSSSKNCASVVSAAGLGKLFDVRVDGVDVARMHLEGKPAPDMFLEAARRLGVAPERAVVFEDALSGVEAGQNGRFGLVVGVDRAGQAQELSRHGADVVVSNLKDVTVGAAARRKDADIPPALARLGEIRARLEGRRAAAFLDYDGTLTPIVSRPELAVLSDDMRATLRRLAQACTVAIVSGRDRADVQRLVGVDEVLYAGSHGFDILGPDGREMHPEKAAPFAPVMQRVAVELRQRLEGIGGALVEPKKFAVAVHYRLVDDDEVDVVKREVDAVAAAHDDLRQTGGKKVFELRPRLDWDKGKAVLWLLSALDLDGPEVLSFYLGDDVTDEDAFAALRNHGIGILVATEHQETKASYVLRDPGQVRAFLDKLADLLEGGRG